MRPQPRSARALAAGILLAAGLVAVPASAPSTAIGIGPLPACRVDDILTVPRGYDDWRTTLVDLTFKVGIGYKPPDLVSVRDAGMIGSGSIRKVALADLKALVKAAEDNGTPLESWSAYRTYSAQEALFDGYERAYGFDEAITFSHRAGHSEHQLGLVIDVVTPGYDDIPGNRHLDPNWEKTETGAWMSANGWKYGWVMSYPEGVDDTICFSYEPWHYRYFGRELAKKIHDSGLTVREYLWTNFTLVDPVTGSPIPAPTATPVVTANPSPIPTALPTVPATPLASPTTAPVSPAPPNDAGFYWTSKELLTGGAILALIVGAGILGFRYRDRVRSR